MTAAPPHIQPGCATHYRDAWRSAIYAATGDYVKTQRAMELAELNGLFDPIDALALPAERPADAQEAPDSPVAWIAFAENGNVRFWTSDPHRTQMEKERGLDLRAFTMAELIALISRLPAPSSVPSSNHQRAEDRRMKLFDEPFDLDKIERALHDDNFLSLAHFCVGREAVWRAGLDQVAELIPLFEEAGRDSTPVYAMASILMRRTSQLSEPAKFLAEVTTKLGLLPASAANYRRPSLSHPSTLRATTESHTHACRTCCGDGYINVHANLPDVKCEDCNGTGRGPEDDPDCRSHPHTSTEGK